MCLHLFNISTSRFTVAEFSQFVDVYAITLMAIFVDSTNVTDHLDESSLSSNCMVASNSALPGTVLNVS